MEEGKEAGLFRRWRQILFSNRMTSVISSGSYRMSVIYMTSTCRKVIKKRLCLGIIYLYIAPKKVSPPSTM